MFSFVRNATTQLKIYCNTCWFSFSFNNQARCIPSISTLLNKFGSVTEGISSIKSPINKNLMERAEEENHNTILPFLKKINQPSLLKHFTAPSSYTEFHFATYQERSFDTYHTYTSLKVVFGIL